MSSVGIPEGTVIKEKPRCYCVWFETLNIGPTQRKLHKKCDYCKEIEARPKWVVGEHKPEGFKGTNANLVVKVDGNDLVWADPHV